MLGYQARLPTNPNLPQKEFGQGSGSHLNTKRFDAMKKTIRWLQGRGTRSDGGL